MIKPNHSLSSSVMPIIWPLWLGGIALVACSWFNLVPTTVGWAGFWITIAVTVIGYLLPRTRTTTTNEGHYLDSLLLHMKGRNYHHALDGFRRGEMINYDGVILQLVGQSEVTARMHASSLRDRDSSDEGVKQHASSVFQQLANQSPEFAQAVSGRSLRIMLTDDSGSHRELHR